MVSERYRKGLAEMRKHLGMPEADQYLAKINEVSMRKSRSPRPT